MNGNAGADVIHGGAGSDRLYGGADDDRLYGEIGTDHLNGNKGSDTIDGGVGNDEVFGGQGDDQVFGGDGNDSVSGDSGADTIHGGAGYDALTGGADADIFAFSPYGPFSLSEAGFDGTGLTDSVTDFQDGSDKFSLGFMPAAVLNGGAQGSVANAAAVATQLFASHAGDHEVAAIQVGADAYLFFSATGGGVDSAVRLDQVAATTIDVTDFV